MFTAFQTALSALKATSTGIDATSNNLANLSTTGFKASDVSFQDLVTQSFGGAGQLQNGAGISRTSSIRNFNQGVLAATSAPLDAAIQGSGFFVLKGANNIQELTRAGKFKQDASGTLMTLNSEKVQGWTGLNADGSVNTNGPVGDIQLPTGILRQPFATQNFSLDLNLNAAGAVGSADGSFSTPIQVVDSLGTTQNLTASFTKTANNAWTYSVSIPNSALTTPGAAPLATGSLTFDTGGKLLTPAPVAPATVNNIVVKVTGLADGAADLNMNWNLSNPAGDSRFTQVAEPSQKSASSQDGADAAQLVGVSIGDGGALFAQFSNGQQKTVGQLAIAGVRNPDSLTAVGNNNFEVSALTSSPVIGAANTGGRGNVLGGSLESSTVDIAKEFTNLIVYQRGYQANAKVINTEDQLSQEAIGLKQ
ncbi:MAG: flagellar hook protein FlgE [Acidobacteriota bacterium]|nr:flagellar hook protein FlgE [Acidobacteriota bacterium]